LWHNGVFLKLNYEGSASHIFVDILTFIATVIVVTASGALAPGPLLFTNITHGTKSGAKGGLAFSVGHTIFELSLVIFLALTLHAVANQPLIQTVVGVAGGFALLVFGFLQIREALTSSILEGKRGRTQSRNPFLLGTLFTGLNPYFIIWWFTIGITLIVDAINLASFAGVFIMYISHVWMDYAWLISTACLAKKGTNLAGKKGYRLILIIFGAILICFGFYFLITPFIAPS
jgi:threonine/homoserine/homoserine lactone efflux protein